MAPASLRKKGFGTASVDAIIDDQVYLGNLTAALSDKVREDLGITHVLSVCPENPSKGPNHVNIAVDDCEYEDLLIRLPDAVRFIQEALDAGGKVLVHCVMGISRSTTVVSAYLMWSRHLSASAAIRFVKQRRPVVNPNYGFTKQLQAYADCNYAPSSDCVAYRTWKRKQKSDVTAFLNQMVDTIAIIPDQVWLSSEFPENPEQGEALLAEYGMTHLLSLSPAEISSAVLGSGSVMHHHINIANNCRESLLLALPDACKFIADAVASGGQVLVHCLVESRASTVVCAYLMASRKISSSEAFSTLEDALPLFNPTSNFSKHLELFQACNFHPTAAHPAVRAWNAECAKPPPSPLTPSPATTPLVGTPDSLDARAQYFLKDTHNSIDVGAFKTTLKKVVAANGRGGTAADA